MSLNIQSFFFNSVYLQSQSTNIPPLTAQILFPLLTYNIWHDRLGTLVKGAGTDGLICTVLSLR